MYIQKFPHCRELQELSAGSSVIAIFFSHLSDDAEVSFFVHTSHTSCKLMWDWGKTSLQARADHSTFTLNICHEEIFHFNLLIVFINFIYYVNGPVPALPQRSFFSEDLELDCACAWWVRKHVEMECFFARGFQWQVLDFFADKNFSPPLKNFLEWKQTFFEWNFVFI